MDNDTDWPEQVGSFSTQVVIRDCEFKKNVQSLVVWSDWASFSDSWITSSPNMSDAAVIENHDKIMISNILGVPQVTIRPSPISVLDAPSISLGHPSGI